MRHSQPLRGHVGINRRVCLPTCACKRAVSIGMSIRWAVTSAAASLGGGCSSSHRCAQWLAQAPAPAGRSSQLPTEREDLVAWACSSAWRQTGSFILASTPHPLAVPKGNPRPQDGWVDGVHDRAAPLCHPPAPCLGHRGQQALAGAPQPPLPSGTPRHGARSLCGPCSRRRASPSRPPSPCSSQQWWSMRLGM